MLVLMFAAAASIAVFVPGRRALNLTALAFFGLVWLVSGTITLWLYLRQPRTPEQGDR